MSFWRCSCTNSSPELRWTKWRDGHRRIVSESYCRDSIDSLSLAVQNKKVIYSWTLLCCIVIRIALLGCSVGVRCGHIRSTCTWNCTITSKFELLALAEQFCPSISQGPPRFQRNAPRIWAEMNPPPPQLIPRVAPRISARIRLSHGLAWLMGSNFESCSENNLFQ